MKRNEKKWKESIKQVMMMKSYKKNETEHEKIIQCKE